MASGTGAGGACRPRPRRPGEEQIRSHPHRGGVLMSDVSELSRRVDRALAAVKDKAQQQTQQRLQEHQERQGLLKEYEKAQARIVEIAKPRLETLSKRAGERVKVSPNVSQTRRSATFEFKSAKAQIALTFSVAPD